MRRKPNEEWTGVVVGKMHQWGIKSSELARYCGYTTQYISMLLNGKKKFGTEEAKEKTKAHVMNALDNLVEEVCHEYDSH